MVVSVLQTNLNGIVHKIPRVELCCGALLFCSVARLIEHAVKCCRMVVNVLCPMFSKWMLGVLDCPCFVQRDHACVGQCMCEL